MKRIVVGVDGSQNSRAALAWAVGEATLHGASLEAIMVWNEPYYGGTMVTPVPFEWAEVEASHRKRVDELIDDCDTSGLENPVEVSLERGSASHQLLSAAKDADLLVVGTRGHGGFVGLLLGSVSNQVVAHAPCPVVVVPGPEVSS